MHFGFGNNKEENKKFKEEKAKNIQLKYKDHRYQYKQYYDFK